MAQLSSQQLVIINFSILIKENFRNDFYEDMNMTRFYSKEFEQFANVNIEKWTRIVQDWVELGDTLVVHLEDVVDDKIFQIRRILKFLGIVPDERRLKCVKYGNFDIFKRKPIIFENSPYVFGPEKIHQNIEKANKILLRYGHSRLPIEKYKEF